jgi:excisionase family DNA binding protein
MSDENGIGRKDPSILDSYGEELKQNLAAQITNLIHEKCMTQTQVAQLLGINTQTVADMMAGNVGNLPFERLEDLHTKLQVFAANSCQYEVMTLDEVANYLRVDKKQVYDWVDSGTLESSQTDAGVVFEKEAIESLKDRPRP